MVQYRVFSENHKGKYSGIDRVYYGVSKTVRRWFIFAKTEVLHYFRTEAEAYQFVLECRRADRRRA